MEYIHSPHNIRLAVSTEYLYYLGVRAAIFHKPTSGNHVNLSWIILYINIPRPTEPRP